MEVNGIRSEPGYTRLSQDDGSIQSKLPQISSIGTISSISSIVLLVVLVGLV